MAARMATGALGVLLMTVGLATVYGEPFLGWLDVSLGILALLSIAGTVRSRTHVSSIGPVALGAAALVVSVVALAARASSTLAWWTLAIAMGLFALGVPELRRNRL
jgi:hypothetical protein